MGRHTPQSRIQTPIPKLHVSCHTTCTVTCDTEHRMSQTDEYGKAHLCTTSRCLADHDRGEKFLVTEIFEKRGRSLKGKGHKVHDDNHIKEQGRTKITTMEYMSLHVCVTAQPWLTLWPAMSWDPRHFTDAFSWLFPWRICPSWQTSWSVGEERCWIYEGHTSPHLSVSHLPDVTIMGMELTWLQVQYHMNNSRSPWDIFSTSLPQDPKKGWRCCLLTSKKQWIP